MIICDSTICTGCGLCFEVCPSKAIEMKPNEYGFIHPVVQEINALSAAYVERNVHL